MWVDEETRIQADLVESDVSFKGDPAPVNLVTSMVAKGRRSCRVSEPTRLYARRDCPVYHHNIGKWPREIKEPKEPGNYLVSCNA